jgi:hypothetical protein
VVPYTLRFIDSIITPRDNDHRDIVSAAFIERCSNLFFYQHIITARKISLDDEQLDIVNEKIAQLRKNQNCFSIHRCSARILPLTHPLPAIKKYCLIHDQ